jgi:WXG100 family type VII secretion target
MSQLGGNPEELAALRASFERHGQTLDELAASLRTQLEATAWHGPAADRLRAEFSGEFEPTLMRMQAALRDAAAEISRRREALLQAGG